MFRKTKKKRSSNEDEIKPFDWDADVVAFACGELGLRLEEFYEMPWCEFLIKSYAYSRMQEEKLRHTRLIAYSAQIGSHLDPKKLPRSIDQFMRIGSEENSEKSNKNAKFDDMKELFKKRMQEYKNQIIN
jgi:hypothetical protein